MKRYGFKSTSFSLLMLATLSLALIPGQAAVYAAPASLVVTAKAVEAPFLLQYTSGGRTLGFTPSGMYAATGSHSLGQKVSTGGTYKPHYPLTIDPTLTWNIFLGGGKDDRDRAIATDGGGLLPSGWFGTNLFGSQKIQNRTARYASFTTCADVTEIPVSECNALVALYNSTDGAHWTNNTDWLTTDTPCSWYGVSCYSGIHVTTLSLSSNQLLGAIPTELGNLTNLVELFLDHNQLLGAIPTELGNLTNLITLNLAVNQLNSSTPTELGNLTKLIMLNLASNQLNGSIPIQLGNLENLMTLSLSGNQLSGSIPPQLGNLTSLRFLSLSDNQLSGSIPIELGSLTNLTSLNLSSNQLSGSIPTQLGNLTNLAELGLYNNQLSGSIPAQLGSLTNLKSLNLSGNRLSGSIPTQLGSLTNLTALYLYDNQLSGSIPPELGNLANLTTLYLYSNQLNGSIPNQLGNLTNLVQLYLDHNQLSGEFPTSITHLVNLTTFTFDCGLTSSDPAVIAFINNLVPGWLSTRCAPIISGNAGIAGATLSYMDGTAKTVTADSSGLYSFVVSSDWSGDVTPSKTDYSFMPVSRSYTNVLASQTAQNYTATYVLFTTCADVIEIPVSECNALVALYNSTDGAHWTNNTDWLTTSTPCSWYGVSCGSGTHVTALNLSNNQLSGSIPTVLVNLTNLTVLSLNNNQLSSSIPTELGNLTNLSHLYLNNNQLSGSIPTQLGSLTNLMFLNLSSNQLSGSIPTQMGSLIKLTILDLQVNQLSGPIPAELGNLTNLTMLILYSNQLGGSIPTQLGNLTKLTYLYLHSNQLSGSIPPELGNLTNLTSLSLCNNQLSGSIPTELGNLTKLTWLDLFNNQFSGSIPAQLGSLTNLTSLNLFNNQLSGSIPTELSNLTNLFQLYLNNNQLSGEFPTSITNLVNLTTFAFDCGITSSDSTVIAFIDNLVPGWQAFRCLPIISGNAGVAGATLSYMDGTLRIVTANTNGDYSFTVSYNWSGIVTLTKTSYVFVPPSKNYTNVLSDQANQNYTTYIDSDGDGQYDLIDPCPIDATNTCDPNGSQAAVIGSGGGGITTENNAVSITIPPGALPGDTVITITDGGSGFDVGIGHGNLIAALSAKIGPEGMHFAKPIDITFKWQDVNNDGKVDGMPDQEKNLYVYKDGVRIAGPCKADPTHCDMNANTYIVQVSSLSFFVIGEVTYSTSGNASVGGAILSYTDGSPVTADSSGNYTLTVPSDWSGTVTPFKAGYSFSPVSITVSIPVTDNLLNQNFTATLNTYTVSGTLGTTGATVAFSGTTSGSVTISGSSYSFTAPYGWTGTITPSKAGYSFSPLSITVSTPLTANLPNQNFTATLNTAYTISGNAGVAGATLSYTDGTTKATADGSGNYSFTVLSGWSGTVTPSKTGYTFTPASKSYTNVLANQVAQNYTATGTVVTASDGTDNNKVNVSWTASSGATYYVVYRSDSLTGAKIPAGGLVTTSLGGADIWATPGVTYYYWVKACNDSGCNNFSIAETGWRGLTPPVVTSSNGVDSDKVHVTMPAVNGATSYLAYRSETPDGPKIPANGYFSTAPSGDDLWAAPGVTYYYWVKACNGLNCSALSAADTGWR